MTTPHYLTLSDNAEGHRVTGWAHPADCPDGEACDINRRTQRMGLNGMTDLGEGRKPGRYLLGCSGPDALILVDEQGQALPDVPYFRPVPYNDSDPRPPADELLAVAAYELIRDVVEEIAEFVVEDSEMALSCFEEIRKAQVFDDELRAVRPRNILINDFVGKPAAYTAPIVRLLEQLGVPVPTTNTTADSETPQ